MRMNFSADDGKLYDVLAISLTDSTILWVEENQTLPNAEAVEMMAVMRQGCEDRYFTHAPAGSYKKGDTYNSSPRDAGGEGGGRMKVGDKVLINNGSGFNHYLTIGVIERETKTQWIVYGRRYHKKTLYLAEQWSHGSIEELTPENQSLFDAQENKKEIRRIWQEIDRLKYPFHLSPQRLQEIYNELKGD